MLIYYNQGPHYFQLRTLVYTENLNSNIMVMEPAENNV